MQRSDWLLGLSPGQSLARLIYSDGLKWVEECGWRRVELVVEEGGEWRVGSGGGWRVGSRVLVVESGWSRRIYSR